MQSKTHRKTNRCYIEFKVMDIGDVIGAKI